jgi:type 1 glutamine amidotransferase
MRHFSSPLLRAAFCWLALISFASIAGADEPQAHRPKRLVLLWQGPDGHPFGTHEYAAGMRLLGSLLEKAPGVQPLVIRADEPWKEGPEVLDGADGALLFLSEGATWLSRDADRLRAFERLAARGGGLAVLHWGMGSREADPVPAFVKLFGGCHGGPDRKYKVLDAHVEPATPGHPVLRGIRTFDVHEEFYYQLKFPAGAEKHTPLLRVEIDDAPQTVCWAWERPDGGRSFGFSGCHFHKNWERPEYRRLALQGVLWTLTLPIPEEGSAVNVNEADLALPEPKK